MSVEMTLIKSAAYGDAWLCDKCLRILAQRIEYSVYDCSDSPFGKCHECGKTAGRD